MKTRILTFQSIHHVLKAEKLLIKSGFKIDIIPTPKNISSDCGMSIRTISLDSEIENIKKMLNENNFVFTVNEIR